MPSTGYINKYFNQFNGYNLISFTSNFFLHKISILSFIIIKKTIRFKNSIQLYEKNQRLDINFHIFFRPLSSRIFQVLTTFRGLDRKELGRDTMVEFILISLTRPSFAIPSFTFEIRDKGK